ncbi:MAG: NAD(P)/FAD-dependent oxidoreductase [Bdellovibrio sp.]|nr:NAD(P)/FAD-dependent oxidoreductase [Bdellovibrio sp.]
MRIIHPAKKSGSKIVIIIGGGFAGLNAAKTFVNKENVFVILIDQRNHHLFQPLLYQVATAGLSPADIAVPIRGQFSQAKNVEVHLGRVTCVNLKNNFITVDQDEFEFDSLIVACGAQHSYFAHPEWEIFAPGLKTLEQATEIRRRILSSFENAENEMDPKKQQALLTFVVVGGGPTGVELAGAIADISRTVLIGDFRRIDSSSARILLVEAGTRVLASFDDSLSIKTKHDLEGLGVEVMTSARVANITSDGVQVGDEFISAACVFWAAGVQAAKMNFEPEVGLDRAGRVKVNKDLSIPGYKNAFVIGDMASVEISAEKFVPGLAPAAIQAGKHCARTILATFKGQARTDFKYVDKGQMATIGKYRAVMQSGPVKLVGYLAWLAWLFIHIFYLVGFKNRVSVLADWVWNYTFSKRGSRLITESQWQLKK